MLEFLCILCYLMFIRSLVVLFFFMDDKIEDWKDEYFCLGLFYEGGVELGRSFGSSNFFFF